MSDLWQAAASGLLLTLSAPGSGLGALAWIALVPLYRALAGATLGRAAFLGWVTGFAFAATTFWWIALPLAAHSRLGPIGGTTVAVAVAAIHAVPLAAYGAALAFHERRLGRFGIVLAVALWAALEWARTLGPLPLPWSLLGYSQPARAGISQIAEWTGVYGVGAVIVLVNATIHVGTSRGDTGRRGARRLATATLLVIVAFGVGEWRRSTERATKNERTLRVGIVQPALPPASDPGEPDAALAEELSRRLAGTAVDVIVWPEGAVRFAILDQGARDPGEGDGLDVDRRATERLLAFAREIGRPLVVGAAAVVSEPLGRGEALTSRNRVVLVEPTGAIGARVDKRILVPFGEVVPFRSLLPGVRALVPGRGEYRPGTGAPILRLAGTEAAVVVCWEAIFPAFVAEAAAGASLILDLTNDAWLAAGVAAEQHFAMAAMRAVETRRSVVRAANSGISAFVDPDGTIRQRTSFGARGAIAGEVHLRSEPTFYARRGDVFAAVAALAAVLLLVYAGGSRPRGEEPGILPLET